MTKMETFTPKNSESIPNNTFSWIWDAGAHKEYNAWRWFRRQWNWQGGEAQLAITADSRFRLWINGAWVADGPVRAWPEHYQAERVNLAPYLRPGTNELRVLVQFFGSGNFHVVPQRAGLAATLFENDLEVLRTDSSWEVSEASEYIAEAPRISVQLPPTEIYDARRAGNEQWHAATPIPGPPPWNVERWRDVAQPTRDRIEIQTEPSAQWIQKCDPVYSVPLLHLLYPGTVTESIRMSRAMALASLVEVTSNGPFKWFVGTDWEIYVDGEKIDPLAWSPSPGTHRVAAAFTSLFSDRVDIAFGYPQSDGLNWRHPLGTDNVSASPWVLIQPDNLRFQGDDHYWLGHPSGFLDELETQYLAAKDSWREATRSGDEFSKWLSPRARTLPQECLFHADPDGDFRARCPLEPATLERRGDGWSIPHREGCDIELHFDLGDQIAGFHELETDAPAGALVDLALVEFIHEDGVVQHTIGARNGFRLIAKEGRNTFLSRQRRSGRHLFLTIRNASRPVMLLGLSVIESRYPAESPKPFRCSDDALTRIWAAAHRTMQLSMDDVYIDSLYEQTLWVGDARVEQLYGLRSYDARDISLRSMRLAAESAFRAPMVLSQVPSCWENILPVWSFLWVVSVWDYYFHTGDAAVLQTVWPAIKKNLRGASYQLNERCLMEAPWWNLFEWAHVDNEQRTVGYVSMFFLAAVQSARRIEMIIGDTNERGWLESLERRLRWGLETLWNEKEGLYHESVHRDGTLSARFSIHPQFLAALYGAADADRGARLLDRIASDTTLEQLASPFALQFYCEALEKFGREAEILTLIRRHYQPMVEIGTTLWEALPGSRTTPPGFPTRSHCHGWSACPMDFLPRIVLGISVVEPGSRKFTISPQPHGLTWAEGCYATPFGAILIHWTLENGCFSLLVQHPSECEIEYVANEALQSVAQAANISFSNLV